MGDGPKERKPVRIWVDGCFDMTHYGHFNALRQAKAMGDILVCGVHSDQEVLQNKGPTVMKEEERYAVVAACKWVDEVVPDAPYFTTVEMLDKYNIDFCVHGDDITTTADGTDCYAEVKQAGRYKECKRTTGISTTELVGRMLLMTKDHHQRRQSRSASVEKLPALSSVRAVAVPVQQQQLSEEEEEKALTADLHVVKERLDLFSQVTSLQTGNGEDQRVSVTQYLPISQRILPFSQGKQPKPGQKVVYVDGGFDLFHLGHIELLKRAKDGDNFVIVGVHDDATVNAIRGSNFPVMNLHERVLSVLACRFVDQVLIGAPYTVSADMLEKPLRIDTVIHGKTDVLPDMDNQDPYVVPKQRGIYVELETPYSHMTTDTIIDRIVQNRTLYEARNRRKMEKAALEEKLLKEEQSKKMGGGRM